MQSEKYDFFLSIFRDAPDVSSMRLSRLRYTVPFKKVFVGTIAFVLVLFFFLGRFLQYETPVITPAMYRVVLVSLSSSLDRMDRELPITIQSLVSQTVLPYEIRIYLPLEEEDFVRQRVQASRGEDVSAKPLPAVLLHPVVRLLHRDDYGAATKYLHVIRDMLRGADSGFPDVTLNQPIIIVDDDHSYSPHLVSTLLQAHKAYPDAAVGFRGWRIRLFSPDLEWGVPSDEYDRHVIQGHMLAEPYRVGVLTANEGYLVVPRFFVFNAISQNGRPIESESISYETSAELLNMLHLMSASGHLADDIWMSGNLARQHVPRYVVPLPGPASVDVAHTRRLDARLEAEGLSRTSVNGVALQRFSDAWIDEGIFYRFSRHAASKPPNHGGPWVSDAEADAEPVYLPWPELVWKTLQAWIA
ncbi:hypothetical protein FISHEDRAFT_58928 [Fistulina hepatica ATCC 64428]|uniref:Uncharacterized protein n=1 Tax=Fistulina hepatica ATCC 64428 TaxID=1128425 RepID=A0A0D7AC65_9AGAR|nr:hypothetical protein FISHEDRAFT_58928 [Fistulina hepatica ATCC 64428]